MLHYRETTDSVIHTRCTHTYIGVSCRCDSKLVEQNKCYAFSLDRMNLTRDAVHY